MRETRASQNVLFHTHDEAELDRSKPYASPWQNTLDGRLMRTLYVPDGLTADHARRIVDEESRPHETVFPREPVTAAL
jgi:hypothetical protein